MGSSLSRFITKTKSKINEGKLDEAESRVITRLSVYSNSTDLFLLLAEIYIEKNDVSNARQTLDRVRALDFGNERMIELHNILEENISNNYMEVNKREESSQEDRQQIIVNDYKEEIEVINTNQTENVNQELSAMAELKRMIGLKTLKREVDKVYSSIQFEKNRELHYQIKNENKQSYHMTFTGNPGTGKTTAARLIGSLFKEAGVLEKGHVVEVGRSDIVAMNIGQTAILTKEAIEEAQGGILFIDEAYTLARGGETDFGIEAIDTLVKEMEDKRDNFIVILAGYTNEMNNLISKNPGLNSRININIEFEDFSLSELNEISSQMLSDRDFKLSDSGYKALQIELNKARKGGYFSNARDCRKIIENAIREKSHRVGNLLLSDEEMKTLDDIDFGIDVSERGVTNLDVIFSELDNMVGLSHIKNHLFEIANIAALNKERELKGLKVSNSSNHMMFTGNPGTGKTVVARMIAKALFSVGVTTKESIVEVDRSDLVSGYIGETAIKTMDVIKSAYGGVLFIDEAYSLHSESAQDFGKEAVDTLLKEMEDNRGSLVVIFAGYEKEMQDLIGMNPGLKSRINHHIHFPDYNQEELIEIALTMTKSMDYFMSNDALSEFEEKIKTQRKDKHFANARSVRNVIEEAIKKQSVRINKSGSREDMTLLIREDFSDEKSKVYKISPIEELESMIGLQSVKDSITKWRNLIEVSKHREKQGIIANNMSYHMVFTGNPGTGKTTVARIVSDIFRQLEITSNNNVVEVDRADLVGKYVGETAQKTRKIIESAYGGVLFIDEAYSLARGGENDFGKEAIDTLIKEMEDNRDKFVLILAGYSKEMDDFLEINPGFKSRIGQVIDFPDYTVQELFDIFTSIVSSNSLKLSEDAKKESFKKIQSIHLSKGKSFGNGRTMRNMFEKLLEIQADRIINQNTKDYITINSDDILKLDERKLD